MATSSVVAAGPPPSVSTMVKEVMQSMKTEACGARQGGAHGRPFDEAEGGGRPHAELARQPPLVGRQRVERFEEKPGCQRQVEEDMRDQNAGEAVDAGPCPAGQSRQRRRRDSRRGRAGQNA